jgi:hypothetical protein
LSKVIVLITLIILIILIILSRESPVAKPENDTNGDTDKTSPAADDNAASENAALRINSKGLAILPNGVVSMRELNLSTEVPCKSRDLDALKPCNASLTLNKSFGFSGPQASPLS